MSYTMRVLHKPPSERARPNTVILGFLAGVMVGACSTASPTALPTGAVTAAPSVTPARTSPSTPDQTPSSTATPAPTLLETRVPATASPASTRAPSGPGRLAFDGCINDECGIHVIDPDGSKLELWAADQSLTLPAWSPDGQRIAVQRMVCPPDEPCASVIAMIDASGSVTDVSPLDASAEDSYPAWSPDGSRILFQSTRQAGNQSALFTISINGTGLTEIETGSETALRPAWSPDGAYILFEGNVGGESGLFRMPADGSTVAVLISGPDYGERPDWSADGSRIGWIGRSEPIQQPDGSLLIETIMTTFNPDGGGLTPLQAGRSITWSPLGDRIAYITDDGLWTSLVDGSEARNILGVTGAYQIDWGASP